MSDRLTTRITDRFRDLRSKSAKGLIVYLTAGDPNLDATGELLLALDRAGADVIELGVPFSDPLADGPVIQRASERALRSGTTLRKILEQFPHWRKTVSAPIILFSYFNPVLQYGLEKFAARAAQVGVDGALVVDLTADEAESYVRAMRAQNLDTIFLASPTSTDARLARAAQLSTGFLYLISRTGVTGEGVRSLPACSRWRSAHAGSHPCRLPLDLESPPPRRSAKSSCTPMLPWWEAPSCMPLRNTIPSRDRRSSRNSYEGSKPGRRTNSYERYGGLAQAHRRD